jgi:hypothetical protein
MASHNKKYVIKLSLAERQQLEKFNHGLRVAFQKKQRAQILLMTDQGEHGQSLPDQAIARITGASLSTVERVREYGCEVGPMAALTARKRNRIYERKLDGAGEARLIKIGCSAPPAGAARWSIRLLKDELIRLRVVDSIGDETVRRTLKKTSLNLT